jgi:hypothetical protein
LQAGHEITSRKRSVSAEGATEKIESKIVIQDGDNWIVQGPDKTWIMKRLK